MNELQQLIKKAKETKGEIDPQEVLQLISLISSRHSGKGDKNIEKITGGYKVYYYKNVNGQKIRTSMRCPGKTLKQAKEIRDNLTFEIDKINKVMTSGITLNKWAEEYFDKYAPNSCTPETISMHRQHYKTHIKSTIGNMKLQDLTEVEIRDLQATLLKDYKPRSINLYLVILKSILTNAVSHKKIQTNPSLQIKSVKVPRNTKTIWDIDTFNRFLEDIKDHPYRDLIEADLVTNLRRGEILGLQWKNIDFERQEIVIESQIRELVDGSIGLTRLKTDASYRTLEMDDYMVKLFKRIKDAQIFDQKRLEWGKYKGIRAGRGNCFVFNDYKGDPIKPHSLSQNFTNLVKRMGYPKMTFHGFRALFVSIASKTDQPVYVISKALGHSSIKTTLDMYGHMFPNDDREIRTAVNSKLVGNS